MEQEYLKKGRKLPAKPKRNTLITKHWDKEKVIKDIPKLKKVKQGKLPFK